MEKIWFIHVTNETEGPFTKDELRRDLRLNPDTLVWREGFSDWMKIKDADELKDLFEEKVAPKPEESPLESLPSNDELALRIQKEPPFIFFLLLILTVVIGYAIYLFLNNLQ